MTWQAELALYLACCAAVLCLQRWVLCFVRVQGRSMMPTLHNRDWLFVWRLPYLLRTPRRQEVVICHYPAAHRRNASRLVRWLMPHPVRRWKKMPLLAQNFVKRIIGVPGDTIEVVEGAVQVNGEPLDEGYLAPELCRWMRERPPITLGDDEYFVMGDNRDNSNDSRRVGVLHRRHMRGQVVCILAPLRRRGRVR